MDESDRVGGHPGDVCDAMTASKVEFHESRDPVALRSPEGQATAADLGNFAQAGVDLLLFESKEI